MSNFTSEKNFYIPTDISNDDFVSDFLPGLTDNFQMLDNAMYHFPPRSIDDTGASKVHDGIQDFLNSVPNGSVVVIPPGRYWVEKNTSLPTENFPVPDSTNANHTNDFSCLALINKKNLYILGYGATFFTQTHAQGILELQLCENVKIEGLKFEGYSQFPEIETSASGYTGYGEKGNENGGYDTDGFWGYFKNNSNDTSGSTTHASNGGTGTAWGTFGGGYIGNVSYGVLIHRDCKRITLSKCESSGFNYVGFGVGHNGDYSPTDRGWGDSFDILFENCYGHDNYSANFHTLASERTKYINCVGERAGHPDALLTHDFVDPGYGVTMRGSNWSQPKETLVSGSTFRDNNRKGIDAHSGIGIQIHNNSVEESFVCGIFARWSSTQQPSRDIQITGNKVERCAAHKNNNGTISVGGRAGADYTKSNITTTAIIGNNLVKNCGGNVAIISIGPLDRCIVANNLVTGAHPDSQVTSLYGIALGTGTSTERNYFGSVIGNQVDYDGATDIVRGIQVAYLEEGQVIGNIVRVTHANSNIGIYAIDNGNVSYIGNYAAVNTGRPLNLSQTKGSVGGNTPRGGTEENYQYGGGFVIPVSPIEPTDPVIGATYQDKDTGRMKSYNNNGVVQEYKAAIHVRLIANGGNGTPYYYCGENLVSSIVSSTYGIDINLTSVPSGAVPMMVVEYSGSGGLTTSSGEIGYMYNRSVGDTMCTIGLKASTTSSHTPFSSVTGGGLDILILI